MNCTSTPAPATVRSNGHAELLNDLIFTCSGGTPTPQGRLIPHGDLAIVLDSPITSRLLSSAWSEALLLVDEPSPTTQVVCASGDGVCNLNGTGTGIGSYDGALGRFNVFQGQPGGNNEIDFNSIPFDPPGTNGVRTFRITNIRVNATGAGTVAKINAQTQAVAQTLALFNGQVVANVQTPVTFTAKSIQAGPSGISQFAITASEKFASAFKTRTKATSSSNSSVPSPVAQNIPGQSNPGSETGFFNPAFPTISGRGNLGVAGLADSGTRIYVQISNPGSSVSIAANALANLSGGGTVRLINTDTNGAGSFNPTATCCGAVNLTPDSSGMIRAVFEVLGSSPTAVESVDLPFFLTYLSGASPVTSLTVTAALAPMNGNGSDLSSPLPRFTGTTSLTVAASAATAPIQVSTQQLQFTALQGGDSPGPQIVGITTTAFSQAAYSIVIDSGTQGSAAPSWLSILPNSGITPATLVVSATLGTLPAGTLNARIRVVPKDTSQQPIDIAVTFTITSAPPQMDVSPQTLSFVGSAGGRLGAPSVLEQQLIVRNRGGGTVKFTATIIGGGSPSFITDVTPSSGQTAPDAPVLLRVHANPQGLSPGIYTATIHIVSPEKTIDVLATLQLTAAGPIIRLSSVGLRFLAIAGNPATRSQTVEVIDDGDSSSSVNYTADLLQGSDWLSISNGHGTAVPGKPGVITLVPSPSISTFAAAPRYAVLRVTDTNSQNSPQLLTAVLDIAPSGTPPFPDPFPSGLVFSGPQGSPTLAPGFVSIAVSSSISVPYQASAVTRDGAQWLTIVPATGTTSNSNPTQLQVLATPGNLAPGIYTGDINIAIGTATRTVRVTMIVQPGVVQPGSVQKLVSRTAAGCTPSKLALTDSAFADGSIIPAGYPALLTMLVNDDCGSPVTDAAVVASFDNGDSPLRLSGDGTGLYSNSWVPGRVTPSVTIGFTVTDPSIPPASAGTSAPATSVLRLGTVSANSLPPPVQSPGGTVNNVNVVLGAPLAPGTVASVYGSNLATVASPANGTLPLPTTFSGTQVLVDGKPAPLYFVSPGQLNIQIPFELAANQKYPVLVFSNGVPAIPDTITVAAATPGVYQFPNGDLIAQHQADASLVDSTHPAKPGEALTIYLLGLGLTNPVVASGQASPTAPPFAAVTPAPAVTLDGETIVPLFTGLAPGFVGLYQMNFIVPTDARTGALTFTVTQGSLSGNTTKLYVAR